MKDVTKIADTRPLGRVLRRAETVVSSERGVTMIEILVVSTLLAVMMTLSAGPLRTYWRRQALERGKSEVIAQMQNVQQTSVSETTPYVYGVRFKLDSAEWGIVKFDGNSATTTADDTCVQTRSLSFSDGVRVSAASFAVAPDITTKCRSAISGAASDQFAFFYARGTATGGGVTLVQPALEAAARSVTVTPITGRVQGS